MGKQFTKPAWIIWRRMLQVALQYLDVSLLNALKFDLCDRQKIPIKHSLIAISNNGLLVGWVVVVHTFIQQNVHFQAHIFFHFEFDASEHNGNLGHFFHHVSNVQS